MKLAQFNILFLLMLKSSNILDRKEPPFKYFYSEY